MSKLGLSIYPDISKNIEQDKTYLKKAYDSGFRRLFTNLLSVDEVALNSIKTINEYAKSLGYEVIVDVAPSVFETYGLTYNDLSFFKELHVDGLRLDEGFDGQKEAMMTYNDQLLKIEVNASQDTKYVDNILSYQAFRQNLITCHNFYPQRYTGLSYEQFEKTSKAMQSHNLKVAAFVSSQVENAFGPWPVNDGLCTLEMHRDLPLDLQVRHLYATRLVDDILIANMYASDEELQMLHSIHPGRLTFKVNFNDSITEVEKEIVLNYKHFVRGDMSEFMARSTMPRIDYADAFIPAGNTPETLKRGDICILNEHYGRYKGECHIILKDMHNEGKINVVGHLADHEEILLDFIKPWQPFAIIE